MSLAYSSRRDSRKGQSVRKTKEEQLRSGWLYTRHMAQTLRVTGRSITLLTEIRLISLVAAFRSVAWATILGMAADITRYIGGSV